MIDGEGEPLAGAVVRFEVADPRGQGLYWETTDADGRFTNTMVPTGCEFEVHCQAPQAQFVTLTKGLSVTPGESIDLGKIDITADERPEIKRTPVAKRDAASSASSHASPVSAASPSSPTGVPNSKTSPGTAGQAAAGIPSSNDEGAKRSSTSSEKRLVVGGRVTEPDGQPAVGARVWLLRNSVSEITWDNNPSVLAETTTGAGGRFRFDREADHAPFADRERFLKSSLVIAAVAAGFGPAWQETSDGKQDSEVSLKTATIKARGQILDLEGRPVRGAQLRIIGASEPHKDMPGWVAKARRNPRESGGNDRLLTKAEMKKQRKPTAVYFNEQTTRAIPPALAGPFVADAEGSVDLGKWGDDRLLHAELKGPGIAKSWVSVITFPMDPVPMPNDDPRHLANSYFGADFRLTVDPEQIIQARVTDTDSGTPIAGARVRLYQIGGNLLRIEGFVSATTDAEGKYELRGLTKPKQSNVAHNLQISPGPDTPYFRTTVRASRQSGLGPITQDVTLRRGVWLWGRVTERTTSKPVRGAVSYYPFLENEHARDYVNFIPGMTSMGHDDHYPTAEDGSFRLPAIAGRGVLTFTAEEANEYPIADGVDDIAGLKRKDKRQPLNLYHFAFAELANALREVNVASDKAEANVNVELPRFARYPIRFVDNQGNPLSSVLARCLRPMHPGRSRYDQWSDVTPVGPEATLCGFEELERMPVITLDRRRRLGAVHYFQKTDFAANKAYDLKLEPCATVRGRLVDAAGKPLLGVSVTATWDPFAGQQQDWWRNWQHNIYSEKSDADGHFSLPDLPPGAAYELSAYTDSLGQLAFGTTEILAPGAVVDKGDLACKAPQEEEDGQSQNGVPTSEKKPVAKKPTVKEPVAKKDASSAKDEPKAMAESKPRPTRVGLTFQIDSNADRPATDNSQTVKPQAVVTSEPLPPDAKTATVQGRVVDANRQPIAGADVAVISSRLKTETGGFLSASAETPAAGKTDADGRFMLDFPRLSSKTHGTAHVIARSLGRGLGFVKLKPDDGKFDVALQLLPEETIRGRIVNVDGQPGARVQMRVNSIMPRKVSDTWNWWTESVSYTEAEVPPTAWLTVPATDAEGRFVIHGVPQNHGVYLYVPGNEQFAPQEVRLNTGQAEQRADNDATYRPNVKNVATGEEVLLPLAPAQWFEGVVRYRDTNEPAPHAKVSIWASQERYGSMSSVHGKTDATGHYRISANPGICFGVNCIAPVGTPYLNYKTSPDKPIDWLTGERTRTVDITLPRGVLVRGTIVEAQSGAPIVGASVQYIPENENNPNDGEDVLTGWQNMQSSDDDGQFQIAVLPGPGRLLVHGPDGSYILRETSAQELQRSKRGGQRHYAHAIEKVDPQAGQDPLDLRITLERGATIHGHIVDEQGAPVDDVLVITGQNIRPFWLTWHGTAAEPTKGNEVELAGLEADREYATIFLEPNRRLGAVVNLKATDVEPKIVLHPCVDAKARFVTLDGVPKQELHPSLQVVIKPGGFSHDYTAQRMGELAADLDMVGNVDRVNYLHPPRTDDDGRVVFPGAHPRRHISVAWCAQGSPDYGTRFRRAVRRNARLG